jgi:RND family efflux transporter MFP subunit
MGDPLADLSQLRIDRRPVSRRPSAWPKIALAVTLTAAVGVGATYAFRAAQGSFVKPEVEITEVGWVSPAQATIDLTSTGYVVPQRTAKVGAKVTGRVTKVAVREGQEVKANDLMFELDPTDQRSAVASAQARALAASARAMTARAQLAETKHQVERESKLASTGAVAQSSVDDLVLRQSSLEAQVKAADADTVAAQAEVNALSITLGSFKVVAPIDGIAVTKPSEVGDVVSPISVLVELVDFASLLIETDVPEARMGVVKKGGPCEVVFDAYPDKRQRGEVTEIGPRMNRAKATGLVKVKLLDDAVTMRPDMAARVSFLAKALDPIEMKEPPKIVVPDAAVTERAGAKVVFVVDGDRVHAVSVALGEPLAGGFVLKDGPKPGTRLVKNPPANMSDGQTIKEKDG